jgi:hypothetical protein
MVMASLDFSLSLWKFRCNLMLHGRTQEESNALQLRELAHKITEAYAGFSHDLHIIHHRVHHLFDMPLHQWLHQDKDSLSCFLLTFKHAKDAQEIAKEKNAKVAKTYFHPQKLSDPPSIVSLSPCSSQVPTYPSLTTTTLTSEEDSDTQSFPSYDSYSSCSEVS